MHEDNIRQLMNHLPEGWEEACRETGAMRRLGRVVKTPRDLMWLALIHLSQGQTLKSMSAICAAAGIGKLGDVAFMNRLACCREWFKWMLERLSPAGVGDYLKPQGLSACRVIAVDASDVKSGVSNFSARMRLHFALDVFTLGSRELKITDEKTGESLTRFKASKGDLFLADRAYGTKRSVAHCLSNGADFILRLRHGAFTMFNAGGERIDLLKLLAPLKPGETADMPVRVDLSKQGPGMRELRVCAMKKSEEDTAKAMRRIDRRGSKAGEIASEDARQFNSCVVLATSLPENVCADEILGVYRCRWQIELYFKRLKTLLGTGVIPKKRADCMEAWLNGKMVLAILYEILLSKLDLSPPGE